MSQAQHGYQIEQNQIAQLKRADELRFGFGTHLSSTVNGVNSFKCRAFSPKDREIDRLRQCIGSLAFKTSSFILCSLRSTTEKENF